MKLGSRLRALRNEKGWTQKELGEKLHLSRQSISKWENNNSLPDIYTLILLADAYDMSVVDILDEENQTLLTSEILLDELEKEKVLSFNDQRRKEEMVEKHTKKFLAFCLLLSIVVTVLIGGKTFYDDYQRKKEDESYKITLYGVSDIVYDKEKTILGVDMEYIKELQLDDGTVLEYPTFEKMNKHNLLKKNGEGKKVYRGTIIHYYDESSDTY
ncbi:hypothetical protein IGI37_000188 [Enterococcus sp. AZ194]|uniref:helix-turn-helix domain-containing protein n=1 Tax=Enterococcus sp. AZ194 TaxID=2774629 RepID=UPI003F201071